MSRGIRILGNILYATRRIQTRCGLFAIIFLAIFFISFWILFTLDVVPEPKEMHADVSMVEVLPDVSLVQTAAISGVVSSASVLTQTFEQNGVLPEALRIPSLNMEIKVLNPNTTSLTELDAALLKGAVRYPGSAQLLEEGNVIIFGHSSYLPVVHNPLFKAFNGVQKLPVGAVITVESADVVYEYQVTIVWRAKATTDKIPLSVSGKRLTLITCDSFRSEDDRFVIEADFVKSYPQAN
jgi:LPXTG-site transpeptidase (sortase) family protein